MQPLRATKDLGDIWLGSRSSGASGTAVNSAAFWNKKQEDVAAEDVFFHEYFQQAGKESKKQAKPARAKDGEDEDEDEAGEDEIWKALVSAQPEVDGDDGESEGFDDLDDDEMASNDESLPFDLDDMSDDDASGSGMEDDEELEEQSADEAGSDGLVAVDAEDSDEDKGGQKKKKDERRERRKKLRELPTFASVDDYAELLGQEEDERYD